MPFRVLIVDDSSFFQHRLKEMLEESPDFKVVAVASNGREAVSLTLEKKPDLITMDYEMPVMDGVSAVRQIMAQQPTPILMFSSLTYEGARTTLDALEAGALDFLPKNFAEVSKDSAALKKRLHDRLRAIAKGSNLGGQSKSSTPPRTTSQSNTSLRSPTSTVSRQTEPVRRPPASATTSPGSLTRPAAAAPSAPPSERRKKDVALKGKLKLLVIGASTGGPVAVLEVLKKLPSNFPLPIVLIQHMPENFTKAFAERLNKQCQVSVKEAENNDRLVPGKVLLAPGGKQLMIDVKGAPSVKIIDGDERMNYKPSVDVAFASAANAYGSHVLGVVLTGMGSDGCKGAGLLKQQGAHIWSQDQATSVIYGMPMAVAKAGYTDLVLPLNDIGDTLVREI